MANICPACNAQNADMAKFCKGCGANLSETSRAAASSPVAPANPTDESAAKRHCPKCGAANKAQAKFCLSCGHAFVGAASASVVEAAAVEIKPQPKPQHSADPLVTKQVPNAGVAGNSPAISVPPEPPIRFSPKPPSADFVGKSPAPEKWNTPEPPASSSGNEMRKFALFVGVVAAVLISGGGAYYYFFVHSAKQAESAAVKAVVPSAPKPAATKPVDAAATVRDTAQPAQGAPDAKADSAAASQPIPVPNQPTGASQPDAPAAENPVGGISVAPAKAPPMRAQQEASPPHGAPIPPPPRVPPPARKAPSEAKPQPPTPPSNDSKKSAEELRKQIEDELRGVSRK
jgi:Double zinc ribbon